jgi:RNA polymerase sigma factor (sigma-70 family)
LNASEIVAAIANGDHGAESALVRRYGPGLMHVLLRQARDRDLAEDLYQETILITIERLRTRGLEQPDKLAAFLLGVARQLLRAHRRRQARFASPDGSEEIADSSPSPCEWVIRAEEAEVVRAAMARPRTRRDRDLLCRWYLLDEDSGVSRAVLGLDSRQLSRAIYRARARLREEIRRVWRWASDDLGWDG